MKLRDLPAKTRDVMDGAVSGEPTNVIPFSVRPMEPEDRGFVRETTLKVRMPRGGSWREYEASNLAALDAVLSQSPPYTCTVVADAGGGLLLGFATETLGALSMLYVKRDLRGNGVGLALLGAIRFAVDPGSGRLRVIRPTASFRRWAALHRIAWAAGDGDAPTD